MEQDPALGAWSVGIVIGRVGVAERAEFEATMRRVLALSRADQIRLFVALRSYLGEEIGKETEADRQIALKAQ